MVAYSTLIASAATLFLSQSLASAIPAERITPRGGGFPDSNPPGVSCFNTWETVTNDVCVPHDYCNFDTTPQAA